VTLAIAKNLGFNTLDHRKLLASGVKREGKLFILGSGASINDLTPANFDEIARNTSIGINVWVAHPFVPDYYSFESGNFPVAEDERIHRQYLTDQLSRQEVIDKKPEILLLRPKAPSHESQFPAIPESLKKNTYLTGRTNVLEFDTCFGEIEMTRFLNYFLKGKIPPSVLPDNGASVFRLVFWGIAMGFRDIILVGIDLNEEPYFWYEEPWATERPELQKLFPRAVGLVHDTTVAQDRPLNTSEALGYLASASKMAEKSNIWSSSARSNLSNWLPVHDWSITG